MSRDIESVVKRNLCVGCGTCAGMFDPPAAKIELSSDGYNRPRQLRTLSAAERAEFVQVCPGISIAHGDRGPSHHSLWGPLKAASTGYATDPETRYKGSSGGGISALAIHLLESGTVRGVLHIAPSRFDPFNNIPQISRSRADVLAAAGSRYAPASPLERIDVCLREPGAFAFIGKPCDVAALRSLARIRPEVASKFTYMISFMCAGTPGMRGTEGVIKKLGFEPHEIVNFRYRGNGWPGMARAETADGRFAEMDYDSSWGTILNRHLQFRCKICPDGTGEFADVTCADAWHGDEKGYPVFIETDGRSMVLARTAAGVELVRQACAAGVIETEALDVAGIERMQPYQADRKRAVLARLIGLIAALKPIPRFRNLGLICGAKSSSAQILMRNALGTWLRATGMR